jgi:AcrR family transcriptional regulator
MKVTEAHVNARRVQILSAASNCFKLKGFARTTMQDICREAGLSPGAIYGYFKGKDDIVEQLVAQATDRNRDLFKPAREGGQVTADAIADSVKRFVLFLRSMEPGDIRFDVEMLAEALHTPRIMQLAVDSYRGQFDPLCLLLQQAQEAGHIEPTLNPITLARAIFSAIQGLFVQLLMDPDLDLDTYAELVSQMVRTTLSPRTKGPATALR